MLLNLVTLADTVTKLAARCELCGQPASFSFRKSGDKEKVCIGGADIYMPVCRRHYASGQLAMQTARSILDQAEHGKDQVESAGAKSKNDADSGMVEVH